VVKHAGAAQTVPAAISERSLPAHYPSPAVRYSPIVSGVRPRKGPRRGFIHEWPVVKPSRIRVSDDPKQLAGAFGLFYCQSHWVRPFLGQTWPGYRLSRLEPEAAVFAKRCCFVKMLFREIVMQRRAVMTRAPRQVASPRVALGPFRRKMPRQVSAHQSIAHCRGTACNG
jgi:hypothetical protein